MVKHPPSDHMNPAVLDRGRVQSSLEGTMEPVNGISVRCLIPAPMDDNSLSTMLAILIGSMIVGIFAGTVL